ncbi:preprotein translocase subunit SecD [Achromobacter mucicolens]|jgi:preprotein translocase subunit SecD|uniref:Protein translocase subunit SecD n=1 Tax=Achromobacter mucicolens TaxID=1389922 RepID=A0ABD4YWI9_9BURK|nr:MULTISPECIES: hypothetical protein [Achromobacter]KXJ67081.1 preprotein translocase subunit SecD [Achromobacter xylosoxidans]KRB15691.1 preprotein translocase subunit SecD [Achromobacter sp. Root170]MCP2518574.1 preprotein translocase subunit SecD [Achromobacter mucicolens]MCU6615962.1 preprotein translocase subunit SecD [Achromobacter mucicolens]MDH1179365.1 preprotein translocase subunit SecD [Achromobacter mucicolens]
MQLNLRTLAPALVVVTLALAGCKTAPTKTSDATATPPAGQQSTTPAAAARVDFYLAKREPGAGLREVNLPDGKLYLQETPVLTRADLTDAAALVDRQGQNFVGLRFSEAGTRKLTAVSTANVGSVLALVIDQELVAAPLIGEPLNRGVLAFGVPSAQAASEIAARIRGDAVPAAGGTAPAPAPAAKP